MEYKTRGIDKKPCYSSNDRSDVIENKGEQKEANFQQPTGLYMQW